MEIKKLSTDHVILIDRIKKCIVQDEINHTYRLSYTREWVNKFLNFIVSRGIYTEQQAEILMEFRTVFMTELNELYDCSKLKNKLDNEKSKFPTKKISGKFIGETLVDRKPFRTQ